jgi:hypothetical protein
MHRTARTWVRTAHVIARHPGLGDNFAAGEVSFDQLVAMAEILAAKDAEVVTPPGPFDTPGPGGGLFDQPNSDGGSADVPDSSGTSAEDAQDVLDLAGVLTPAQLAAEAARCRQQAADEAAARFRRRNVHVSRPGGEGHTRLRGDLFDDQGAVLWAALVEYAKTCAKDPVTGLFEPLGARYADALVEMAKAYLAARGQATGRPALIIHADAAILAGEDGWAETDDRSPLHPETVRRMACWAEIMLCIDDKDGNPLYLGRSHRLPTWQLAEMVRRRDGGCRFPGCDRTMFIQPHHLAEWDAHKGATDYTNLAGLCSRHHHLCHEGGWTIAGDPCGELTFTSPDRAMVLTSHPAIQPRRTK